MLPSCIAISYYTIRLRAEYSQFGSNTSTGVSRIEGGEARAPIYRMHEQDTDLIITQFEVRVGATEIEAENTSILQIMTSFEKKNLNTAFNFTCRHDLANHLYIHRQ